MPDRMTQVPVSLIEDTATVLDRAGYHGTAERLRDALLSQPTGGTSD